MIQRVLTKMFDTYKTDFSKTLIHTGVVTYALSSAAQVGAIKFNKNISENQRDYLIKQEIAEGAVNLTLFYTLCEFVKRQAEKFTSNGCILPTRARKVFEELGSPKVTDIQIFLNDKLKICKDAKLYSKIKTAVSDIQLLKPFVNNISGFAAGLLACNIITPYARNIIAKYFHKKD